jgi:ribonuclease VapC|tara:strand:- start:27 stop:416 length:390 start_codon:yes stop_codon:yes gene_type:complete
VVLDSSAVIAILYGEPEQRHFNSLIERDPVRYMSALNLVESSIVLLNRDEELGWGEVDLFVAKAEIEIVAVDGNQTEIARAAFRRFGNGRHRAGLNIGDCFSYALAKARAEPLLCKGDDFQHTDIEIIT